jgi:hypothetical protein
VTIIIFFAITKLDSQTAKFAFDLIQKTYQSLHSANKKETSSRERQRVMEQHLFCPGAFIHSFIHSFSQRLAQFQKPTSFLMSSSASRPLSGFVIMI